MSETSHETYHCGSPVRKSDHGFARLERGGGLHGGVVEMLKKRLAGDVRGNVHLEEGLGMENQAMELRVL